MVIPPINSKGIFTFLSPFDNKMQEGIELKVTAIRSISELISSDIDPYDTIYKDVALSETDYLNDINNKVPIIVFVSDSNDYLYIPANRIDSIPNVSGVKYREKILAMHLGALPIDMDLNLIINNIKDMVYDTIGIMTNIEVVDASADTIIEESKHLEYVKLLNSRNKVNKSYRTMFIELNRIYNHQLEIIKKLEQKVISLQESQEQNDIDTDT